MRVTIDVSDVLYIEILKRSVGKGKATAISEVLCSAWDLPSSAIKEDQRRVGTEGYFNRIAGREAGD